MITHFILIVQKRKWGLCLLLLDIHQSLFTIIIHVLQLKKNKKQKKIGLFNIYVYFRTIL